MLIRKSAPTDIEKLVELWYESTVKAHDFIPPDYWEKNKSAMANEYLPNAETFVAEEGDEILGFVAMVDDYLAAIFVRTAIQAKGVGSELIDYVKNRRDKIRLNVYKKNMSGINFYKKHNFKMLSENLENETHEIECLLEWRK